MVGGRKGLERAKTNFTGMQNIFELGKQDEVGGLRVRQGREQRRKGRRFPKIPPTVYNISSPW